MANIVPTGIMGKHRTGELPETLKVKDITVVLGFKPNVEDDKTKVRYSWGFEVDGHPCGIWDYKGARWSVYDPGNVLPALFGLEG